MKASRRKEGGGLVLAKHNACLVLVIYCIFYRVAAEDH